MHGERVIVLYATREHVDAFIRQKWSLRITGSASEQSVIELNYITGLCHYYPMN